eukprot:scaffold10367_cov103-Isochrysis_galbana.AAC.2
MLGGEKGEMTMEGEMRSRYGGATLQSGGIVCLIVVKCRIQIQQLGVESLWRGYERPTVQKPSQIAADVGGAHTITVGKVPKLPSLRAACRIEALPQSPDLRHPPPRGAWASGLDPQSHRLHRDEQLRQVWDVMYSGVQMTRNCLESARAIPMPMAGGLPLRPTVPGLIELEA